MPELPEVETIVRDLRPLLVGRRIERFAYAHWEKTFATGGSVAMEERIRGRRIAGVSRRAKRIVVEVEGPLFLVVSLRMTGQLYYLPKANPPSSFTRFLLQLDKGFLRFDDARKFGRVWLYDAKTWEAEAAKLGPEPLTLSDADFTALVRRKKGMLKPLLLDQKTLSGVGNIYADEALWLAKLHPRRRAETLRRPEIIALHEGVVRSLEAGIANRGTSIDDYVGGTGEKGANQNFLHAYGRTGQPCERCGTPIEKTVVGQRGTHFCPRCQPVPRAKRKKRVTAG